MSEIPKRRDIPECFGELNPVAVKARMDHEHAVAKALWEATTLARDIIVDRGGEDILTLELDKVLERVKASGWQR